MKTHGGVDVSGQLHAPATSSPGKSPWYQPDRRLGGPQTQFGHCEQKNLSPARIRTLAVQSVACHYTDSYKMAYKWLERK
jgi:hypothetical protein